MADGTGTVFSPLECAVLESALDLWQAATSLVGVRLPEPDERAVEELRRKCAEGSES